MLLVHSKVYLLVNRNIKMCFNLHFYDNALKLEFIYQKFELYFI